MADHQASLLQQLQDFRASGFRCDVTLQSRDGRLHHGHVLVLSAASSVLKAMLCGDFHESQMVQTGGAVNIDASGGAVAAFLDS
eukprot:g21188.t1